MKSFVVNWGWHVEVTVVTTVEEFEDVYCGPREHWLNCNTVRCCCISNDFTGRIVMCLPFVGLRTNEVTAWVAHECLHVLHFLFKHHRSEAEKFWQEATAHPLQIGTNEMEAHMLQIILTSVLDILDIERIESQ